MTKLHCLFGGQTVDTSVQVVSIGQIIHGHLAGGKRQLVVSDIILSTSNTHWYHMIDTTTLNFFRTELVLPLEEKLGIGYYYQKNEPEFMNPHELAELKIRAEKRERLKKEKQSKEADEYKRTETLGKENLLKVIPPNAQSVIVAEHVSWEVPEHCDYGSLRTLRRVFLGFSDSKRNNFDEMRSYAGHFPQTAYLQEKNPDYEHRTDAYCLGESDIRGWIIRKIKIHTIDEFIRYHARDAADPANICIRKINEEVSVAVSKDILKDLHLEVVDYSEASIAIIGQTKEIKDILGKKGLKGLFKSRLTINGEKVSGWIFSKKREEKVRTTLGL